MIEMAQVERIRYWLHVEGKSKREVAKLLGISRNTVAKYAMETTPPKYQRQKPYVSTVMTAALRAEIERLLAHNDTLRNKKQRWIGRTIYLALKELGYQGSEPTVRRYVAGVRAEHRKRTAYVPLEYDPGEVAEFDWGEADVVFAGQLVKVQILCFRLRWSHMPVVIAYPNQRQEAMFDGLRQAFEHVGGVPLRLTSDNLRQAVQKILEGKNRKEQEGYFQFRTHYLVESNFCNPGAGNEKGSVENLVGFAQRNVIGPRLAADTWRELNEVLWQRCLDYATRTFRGESHSVMERWNQEKRVLRPLPQYPYPCCRTLPVSSDGLALVKFDTCRYSVPVQHARQELELQAYWDRVQVYHGLDCIASHGRSHERDQDVLELDHYLELLLVKPRALSQAKPFRMANLPAAYHQFRAELCQRHPHGDREFIRVLMLHREFPTSSVHAALEEALYQRAIHLEGVRQILMQREVTAPTPVATFRDDWPAIRVQQPALALYDRFLNGGAVQ